MEYCAVALGGRTGGIISISPGGVVPAFTKVYPNEAANIVPDGLGAAW